MMLNDRKIKILEAIINDYVASAEPVGSRTIAKKYDLGISSATIRNEMSDLEDMGYIVQPHASAGRIPSDKGYRLYVDHLMRRRTLSEDERNYLQEIIYDNINHIDYLMKETANALARLTNYTTVAYESKADRAAIKHLQLLPFDTHSIVLICINSVGAVENTTIRMGVSPPIEELIRLSNVLNAHLGGLTSDSINANVVSRLRRDFGDNAALVIPIIKGAIRSIDGGEANLYTTGIRNLLSFPEFSDIDRAREIFKALEEKDALVTMMSSDAEGHLQILIGSENNISDMQDLSIVKANFDFGKDISGVLGIIGPTRMDYSQVVSILTEIAKDIGKLLSSFDGG